MRNEINKKLSALFNNKSIRFINTDLGTMSGVIYIIASNDAHPAILSKLVEIDDLLTNTLDADILDTHIHVTYEGETQKLRVKITFDFDR